MCRWTSLQKVSVESTETVHGHVLEASAHGALALEMAGERLQSTAFAEISAVCTLPEFRGRGYARDLVTFVAAQILAAGKTPFLHVESENGAKWFINKLDSVYVRKYG